MDGGRDDEGNLLRDQIVAATIGIAWGLPMAAWAFLELGVIAAVVIVVVVIPAAMLFGIFTVERLVVEKRRALGGTPTLATGEVAEAG